MPAPDAAPRPRYASPPREALTADQQALYDLITSGPRAAQRGNSPFLGEHGELLGPFGPMTIAPAVGEAVQSVGAALRYRTGLSPLVREAAILLVAVARDSAFEWLAHERLAAEAGVTPEQIAAIRGGALPAGLGEPEAAALSAVAGMLADGGLDDATYACVTDLLGERAVAELVWLVGYYSMLALALAVYSPHDRLSTATATPRSEGE